MPSTSRNRVVAEALARRGWPVLPCHHPADGGCSCGDDDCASPAKHPRTRRGLHDATIERNQIRRWWRASPEANVAIRTGGHPDGAGVVVLDVDPARGGEASLAEVVSRCGELPVTLETATGGGGRHLYFAHPGGDVPNSAGRLGPGLDVRGDGGYVLVPPSRHATGGSYRWQPAPIATLPDWLSALLKPPAPVPVSPLPPPRDLTAWAATALAREVDAVRRSAEGTRNHTLNRAAFCLGQLVGGGHLDAAEVSARLTEAALTAGLGANETRATIASGLRAGSACPRHPATG